MVPVRAPCPELLGLLDQDATHWGPLRDRCCFSLFWRLKAQREALAKQVLGRLPPGCRERCWLCAHVGKEGSVPLASLHWGLNPARGLHPRASSPHRPHLPTPAPAGRTPHLSADTAFRQQHPSSSRTSFTWSHSSHLYPSHPQGILLPNVPFKRVAQTEILKINQEYCL